MAILKLEPQVSNSSANFAFGNVFASNFYYANGTVFTSGGGVTVSGTSPTPTTGGLWYDTGNSVLKVYVDPSWTTVSSTLTLTPYVTRKYTANGTGNTYSVTSGCGVDNVLVFINGICQAPTDDYTISSTTLTLVGYTPLSGTKIQIRELPR